MFCKPEVPPMMPTLIQVRVSTMETELEFAIKRTTTGKQLLEHVSNMIGLRESWFFGLQYYDQETSLQIWLKLHKEVASQIDKKDHPLHFRLRAKFFPEDVSEIIQDFTLHFFYLQVKADILTNVLYCPSDTCVFLASYALQIKYGDFDTELDSKNLVRNNWLLPNRVIDQHRFTREQLNELILKCWKEHGGIARDEAMINYLKIAQELEMYSVSFFEMKNKRGTELWLGVDACGLNIYEKINKLTPKVGLPWSEIQNISFNRRHLILKSIDVKTSNIILIASSSETNKRIIDLCTGNHDLYIRRRKPDTMDLQQMKTQEREKKLVELKRNEKLAKEILARKQAEKKQQKYAEQLKLLQTSILCHQRECLLARETIEILEKQMRDLSVTDENIDTTSLELQESKQKLIEPKQLEENRIQHLNEEIRIKEKQDIQLELEKARGRLDNANTALIASVSVEVHYGGDPHSTSDISSQEEESEAQASNKKSLHEQREQLSRDLEDIREMDNIAQSSMLNLVNYRL